MKRITFCILWFILFLFWPCYLCAATETVRMPITLDYSLLRTVFIQQAYTQPGERAVPLDRDNGCTQIELWEPGVGPEQSLLKLGSNIKVRAGLPISGKCIKFVEWDGYIEVLQRIWLDEKSSRLRFETADFRTFTSDRKLSTIDKTASNLINTFLSPLLNKVSIDLSLPVKGLQSFLPLFFSGEDRSRIESSLKTLRPSQIQFGTDSVSLDMLMDVETLPKPEKIPGAVLPETELSRLVKAWEDWDAYSVNLIEALIGNTLTEDERDSFIETLLETRYGFVQSLNEGTLTQDLIRGQFTGTWQRLAPILKKYLTGQQSRSPLDFLAFFTVSDALVALDKFGPSLGININREGLLKLTGFLGGTGIKQELNYFYAINPNLRIFFGLGPPLDESGPALDIQEIEFPEELQESMIQRIILSWSRFWVPLANAEEGSPDIAEIRKWIFRKEDISSYLNRVKLALDKVSGEVLSKNKLDKKYQPLYQLLVFATAWQESCWRQFINVKGKVQSILSYNNTSVGLMQINERVWRGIYRPESLRWNINYNICAGSEILDLYLRKYALRKTESRNMDIDTLARAVYAMYNGGPGQFRKFLTRNQSNSFYKSDQLFWQKYTWVKANQLDKLSICLIGR